MRPMIRKQLDAMRCGVEGCTHEDHGEMYVHASCHPKAGCEVKYTLNGGVLTIRCNECKRSVAEIQVAGFHRQLAERNG